MGGRRVLQFVMNMNCICRFKSNVETHTTIYVYALNESAMHFFPINGSN